MIFNDNYLLVDGLNERKNHFVCMLKVETTQNHVPFIDSSCLKAPLPSVNMVYNSHVHYSKIKSFSVFVFRLFVFFYVDFNEANTRIILTWIFIRMRSKIILSSIASIKRNLTFSGKKISNMIKSRIICEERFEEFFTHYFLILSSQNEWINMKWLLLIQTDFG